MGGQHLAQPVDDNPRRSAIGARLGGRTHLALQHGEAVLFQDSGLAHYLLEDDSRDGPSLDEVSEQVSRAYRWKLVVVSHEDDARLLEVDRPEELPRQRDVHHRHLVDDDDVGIDGLVRPRREGSPVEAEEPVECECLAPHDLLDALGGLPGRRRQDDIESPSLVELGDGRDQPCLASPRRPADEHHVVPGGRVQAAELRLIQVASLRGDEALDVGLHEVRIRPASAGEDLGELALHLMDARLRDEEAAAEGHAGQRAVDDEGVQRLLDAPAAVMDVHHQEQVRHLDEVLVVDPAVTLLQSLRDAVDEARADARGLLLRCAHLLGNDVDALETEAGDFAHQEVGVLLEDGDDGVAELLDEGRHLVVRQLEGGEPGEARVQRAPLEPLEPQSLDGLHRYLCDGGDALGLLVDDSVKVLAEGVDDAPRLHRADALDVGVVGQVVGEPLGTWALIEAEASHLQLPAELGVALPGAMKDDWVLLAHHEGAGEGDGVPGLGAQLAGAEAGAGVEERLHPAPDRLLLTIRLVRRHPWTLRW